MKLTKKQRFEQHFIRGKLNECWPFKGRKASDPRANFDKISAARMAWILYQGPIPKGKWVLHHCDHQNCVNYRRHLYLGTASQNTQDAVKRDRWPQRFCGFANYAPRGKDHHNVKLTITQVQKIRRDKRVARIIAQDYKVSKQTIDFLRSRRHIWLWVD